MDVGVALTLAALVIASASLLLSAGGARRHETRIRLEDHEERLKKCEEAKGALLKQNGDLQNENFRLYRENDELRHR